MPFKFNPITGQLDLVNSTTAGSGYSTVQEEGTPLAQQTTLNFIGAALTASDDGGNSRTNVTLSQSPASASVVGTGRTITAGTGLSGGGDLSADRTVSLSVPVVIANGGTNSTASLNNNRVMQSSGGAIVEAAAITAARALKSDANGIPVASTATAADLDALSGTNTGNVSLAAVGASPNANAASLSGQVLNLQPADGTNPGVLTAGVQTIGGAKTFTGAISASNLSGTNTGDQTITLTGDVTGSGTGSFATTLATVNGNVGTFGSSTSIPTVTVNAKGLVTAVSGNAVIAPAGTLTGTTLNSSVVSSSLTSVGTITTGVWNGTTIAIANGGTGQTAKAPAFDALSPMTTQYDLIIGGAAGTGTRLAKGANGTHLTTQAGVVAWTTDPTPYSISTITANTSGVSGTTYLCDTSGGAFTLTLPTPSAGAFVAIKDKTGSFNTNNLTVARSSTEKIEGLSASKLLQTNWGAWSFFSDGTDWFMGPF